MIEKSEKVLQKSFTAHPSFVKERNIENYLDKIKLKATGTRRNIKNYITRFDQYLQDTYSQTNQEILDEILSMPPTQQDRILFDLIQDFVNFLSGKTTHLKVSGISAGYVRHAVYGIKGYLRFYGFKITSDDIKDNVTLPRVLEEEREPLTREQLQQIVKNQTGIRKVLYMVMSSTGMRPSEILMIKKSDLVLDTYERIMVKLPANITKTKKPRITFISQEAEKELVPYLKDIKDDEYIFNQSNLTMEQVRLNEEKVFGRLRTKLGFLEKYESGIHKVSLGDSLRSWFITKCNRVDYGFGHSLAGHDQYMKRYDRLTVEDKVELYLKSEQLLQVFDYVSEDQEQRIKLLGDKVKDLESEREIMSEKLIENLKKNHMDELVKLVMEKTGLKIKSSKKIKKK